MILVNELVLNALILQNDCVEKCLNLFLPLKEYGNDTFRSLILKNANMI